MLEPSDGLCIIGDPKPILTMKTNKLVVEKFTSQAAALKALSSQAKCYDDMNSESSSEYGHVGPRMIRTRPENNEIARVEDTLGSGDFYAIICNEDETEFALITQWS